MLYSPIILSISKNYAIATVSKTGLPPTTRVTDAVVNSLMGKSLPTLDKEEAILALAILYGGIILVDIGGEEVIPLSRILPENGIRVGPTCKESMRISDQKLLQMWRRIYKGSLNDALKIIGHCSFLPQARVEVDPKQDPLPVGYYSLPR